VDAAKEPLDTAANSAAKANADVEKGVDETEKVCYNLCQAYSMGSPLFSSKASKYLCGARWKCFVIIGIIIIVVAVVVIIGVVVGINNNRAPAGAPAPVPGPPPV